MNQPISIHFAVEDEAAGPPPEPQVYVRTVSAPAGMPWSQARIAALEARLGAPLPLHEVVYQVHRLEAWRPGQPARYATFYVRAKEVGDELSRTMQVDGRPISIQFVSAAEQSRRARRVMVLGLVAAVFAALVVGAITTAVAARAASEERLASVEHLALSRLRQAEAIEHLKDQTRALNSAGIEGRRMSDLFRDLNWTSAAKAPGAHIEAFHWRRGVIAVEVRGEAPPFAQPDRNVVRVAKPIRPGTWLWGATPTQPGGDRRSGTSSTPLPSTAPDAFGSGG